MASERKDFVVYGASGYTGQYVVKEVARKAKDDGSLSWAIAGRSRSKLTACLKAAESELGMCSSLIIITNKIKSSSFIHRHHDHP